jgi:hypothetical protein
MVSEQPDATDTHNLTFIDEPVDDLPARRQRGRDQDPALG